MFSETKVLEGIHVPVYFAMGMKEYLTWNIRWLGKKIMLEAPTARQFTELEDILLYLFAHLKVNVKISNPG